MSKDYKHELPNDVSEEWKFNNHGGWRPTLAWPYFVGFGLRKARCGCGRKFKTIDDYYAHYLYMAIWKGESSVLPVKWADLSSKENV